MQNSMLAVGKEWACCQEWFFRLWGLGGVGMANRGSPWVHGVGAVEGRTTACTTLGLFPTPFLGLDGTTSPPICPLKATPQSPIKISIWEVFLPIVLDILERSPFLVGTTSTPATLCSTTGAPASP